VATQRTSPTHGTSRRPSRWRLFLSSLGAATGLVLRDPYALIGTLVYLVFILVAIFADRLAPYDPLEILFTPDGMLAGDLPPSREHPLGTTNLGKDIYSQLIYGTRSALIVGVTAAFLEPSIWNIVLAMALVLWRDTGRVIRSQVLTVRERAFVEAAKVTGSSPLRILFVHIAPNILPLSFLYGSIAVGWAILTEASISFLGFGDSEVISWGYMLQDAFISQALSRGAYHWFVPPGLAIVLIVVAGFFISRGYEELLFPKLKEE
jgi:peptide/nickel transport system permease protein